MSGRRDVNSFERALTIKMIGWSLPGVVLGLIVGALTGHLILGPLVGGGAVFLLVRLIVGGTGEAARVLHNPSGRSTPHVREYSAAESLVVRGRYAEAVAAFEEHVAEHPEDALPYLRLARIHRDHLGQVDAAANWFRRACREAKIERGMEFLARRELIELYLNKSNEPGRAAPELARLAEMMAGTPEGAWAERELAELKERLRGNESGE